jgi:hypothetical protein
VSAAEASGGVTAVPKNSRSVPGLKPSTSSLADPHPVANGVSRPVPASLRQMNGASSTGAKRRSFLYQCPYCPTSFAGEDAITSHVRQHIHDTPYSCSCCNMRAVNSAQVSSWHSL